MSVRFSKKVKGKPGACDEIPEVSVFAVDKAFRVLVVVADETPSRYRGWPGAQTRTKERLNVI